MLRGKANKRWFGMTVIIVCLAVVGAAQADWPQQDKLLASDGAAEDRFGISVSIDSDYAVVGAHYDDDNGDKSGSAYIFKRDGSTWTEKAKLTASDGADGDHFSRSVSISGEYAIVGAPENHDILYGSNTGSAYIFKRNEADPNWTQQAKLMASDCAARDHFGCSVSISGDYVIVGAAGDDDNTGSAYIFVKPSIEWVDANETAKLLASDGAVGDCFGASVSLSGDYAIVGAYFDDDNGVQSGSAYIFKNWTQQAKLTASDGAKIDQFGFSVSISGDYAVVGAFSNDAKGTNSGAAYIFAPNEVDSNNWDQQAKLTASDGAAGDYFGWSVSINGGYAIVGAHGDDVRTGSAYMFETDGTDWSQKAKLTASDGAAENLFGDSVSITSNVAIVGATWDDDNGSKSGSAYVFQKVCPTADLSGDCSVDFIDFAILGYQWRQAPGDPSADIAPEGGDGVVNFLDLAIMVSQWLQSN